MQENIVTTPSETSSDALALKNQVTQGWSWAGSFLTLGTLFAGKKWGLFTLNLILTFIPLANVISMIAFFFYGGFNGKKIIYDSPRFENHTERVGAIKAMESVGIMFAIFILAGVIFYFLLGALFIGAISSLSH